MTTTHTADINTKTNHSAVFATLLVSRTCGQSWIWFEWQNSPSSGAFAASGKIDITK